MAEEQILQEVQQEMEQAQPIIQNDTPDQGSFEDMFNNYEVTPNQAAFSEDKSFTSEEPAAPPVNTPLSETNDTNPDNEQVRFTYWQSQADKLRNELEAKDLYIKNTLANQQAPTTQEATAPEVEGPSTEEFFPPPPGRPQKPRSFSREDAYTNPQSDSAAYADDLDEWRDQMGEYNRLHSQWQLAKVQEQNESFQKEAKQSQMKREAVAQQNQEVEQMVTHVGEKYQMNPDESLEFVKTMSNPESITMDNLVELYRMQKGIAPAIAPPIRNTPSKDFTQVQRAQSVPRPMGVATGINTQTEGKRDPVDSIADMMINQHNNATSF
jgi:hypothetical protein